MKRNRFGKIVATVGPSSSSHEMLKRLYVAGVDVFRLNFSHGSHETHKEVYDNIRSLSKDYGYNPCILADMQGPKLRIGKFANGKEHLEIGDIFRLDLTNELGDKNRVTLPHQEILQAVKIGSTLLVDDGKIKLEVIDNSKEYIVTKVIIGGTISDRKGVNVPDVVLPIQALTEKDLRDLEFALNIGVDWIAVSFVQNAEDVEAAKKIINGRAKICTKIEKPSAVYDLERIVEASDAIMVARGDLAVEMSPQEVPIAQRKMLEVCHRIGRPIIVATQMLESMITLPTPTRAEASDVANAVYSGADATMLSAESAAGSYPIEAVEMMNTIICTIEKDPSYIDMQILNSQIPTCTMTDACSSGIREISDCISASTIALFTDDMETVVRCSRMRPYSTIIVATNSKELVSKVNLVWGTYAVLVKKENDISAMISKAREIMREHKIGEEKDNFIVYSDIGNPVITISRL